MTPLTRMRLTPALLARLDAEAARLGLSRTAAVEAAVGAWLRDTEITDAERRELLGWRKRRLVTLAGAVWVVTRIGLVELKAPAVAGKESGR